MAASSAGREPPIDRGLIVLSAGAGVIAFVLLLLFAALRCSGRLSLRQLSVEAHRVNPQTARETGSNPVPDIYEAFDALSNYKRSPDAREPRLQLDSI